MTTDGWRPTPQLPASSAPAATGQWPPAPEPAHRPVAMAAAAPAERRGLSVRSIALVVGAAVLVAASGAGGYVAANKWLVGDDNATSSATTSPAVDTTTRIQTPTLQAVLPWSATPEDVSDTFGTATLTGTRWAATSETEVVVLQLFDGTPMLGVAPDPVAQGQLADASLALIAARVAEKGGTAGVVSDVPVNGVLARSQVMVQPGIRYYDTVLVSGPIIVELACAADSDTMPQWCTDVLAGIVITAPAA